MLGLHPLLTTKELFEGAASGLLVRELAPLPWVHTIVDLRGSAVPLLFHFCIKLPALGCPQH